MHVGIYGGKNQYVCMQTSTSLYMYMHLSMYVGRHACMTVHVCMYVYRHTCVNLYVCVDGCMWVDIYVSMHAMHECLFSGRPHPCDNWFPMSGLNP